MCLEGKGGRGGESSGAKEVGTKADQKYIVSLHSHFNAVFHLTPGKKTCIELLKMFLLSASFYLVLKMYKGSTK
jgi:hypothetical protein